MASVPDSVPPAVIGSDEVTMRSSPVLIHAQSAPIPAPESVVAESAGNLLITSDWSCSSVSLPIFISERIYLDVFGSCNARFDKCFYIKVLLCIDDVFGVRMGLGVLGYKYCAAVLIRKDRCFKSTDVP